MQNLEPIKWQFSGSTRIGTTGARTCCTCDQHRLPDHKHYSITKKIKHVCLIFTYSCPKILELLVPPAELKDLATGNNHNSLTSATSWSPGPKNLETCCCCHQPQKSRSVFWVGQNLQEVKESEIKGREKERENKQQKEQQQQGVDQPGSVINSITHSSHSGLIYNAFVKQACPCAWKR